MPKLQSQCGVLIKRLVQGHGHSGSFKYINQGNSLDDVCFSKLSLNFSQGVIGGTKMYSTLNSGMKAG